MKLFEYQSKEILSKFGIPTPKGYLTGTAEARHAAPLPVIVKAQVLTGGRGKAGGVKIARTRDEIEKFIKEISQMKIKGIAVKKVLVEEALDIEKEYYLSAAVDRDHKCNILIFSSEGGIDIEETAKLHPEKIEKFDLKNPHPLPPLPEGEGHIIQEKGIEEIPNEIVNSLIKAYLAIDASLIEINPLVKTKDGKFIAADAKIIIDDNALFRHPEFENSSNGPEEDEIESEAHRRKISYVRLSGSIAVMCNGAGLTMTTMDEVKRAGGEAGCFLDVGGGSRAEFIVNALKIVNMDPNLKGIFFNIFGGISRCDEVVLGIIEARKKLGIKVPIVIRLTGNREKE
ncbi:MAG: ADP-forming succinate--CoA ligase subunit beta, partial [Candidatus Margulisiibacteriota bacterium]